MGGININTTCFHCRKQMQQRVDTIKRQLANYGHNCCKNCFGKEQSFRDARRRVMTENNHCKGKQLSAQHRAAISKFRTGQSSWNKGLTKHNDDRMKKIGQYASESRKGKYIGENNPNWRGGSSVFTRDNDFFTQWLPLRKHVLKEDNFNCLKCNTKLTICRSNVHHIISKSRFPEHRYNRSNLIPLCRTCHTQFHNRFGRIRFTGNDTVDWINEGRSRENYFFVEGLV